MVNSISQKLRIKSGDILLAINEPSEFQSGLVGLPKNVKVVASGKDYNQVHWFVMNQAQLEKEMSKVMKLLKPDVTVWVYFPKGTSGLQTDLNRDTGWDCLMKEKDKLSWINLFSFDATWSIFGFRAKTDADRKKEEKPKQEREIFKWANSATKEIKLPDDLAAVLKRNKKEAAYFETLSFSNKREYVEWIVTAKRDETRTERLKGTIERLGEQWKNPRNI